MVEMTPDMGEGMGPNGGMEVPPVQETFWGKVLRFFKGLLGLDSGIQTPPVETMPTEDYNIMPIGPKG